jgi:hypothetical protein
MYHSADGSMNFGAVYLTADYHHVSRYVARGQPIRLRDIRGYTLQGPMSLWHWSNLRRLRPLGRLLWRLRQFRQLSHVLDKEAEHIPLQTLAGRHPLLDRCRRQPAEELFKELQLGQLHDDYLRLVVQMTCFLDPRQGNALLYLASLLPLIVPTWAADFTRTYDRLMHGCRDRILRDRVQRLDRRSDGSWQVHTAAGRALRATNVVLAIPPHNLDALYPLGFPSQVIPGTVLFVRGQRRSPLHQRFLLLPAEQAGVTAVWRRGVGQDQVFSLRPQPDLQTVFQRHEVIEAVSWKTAIVLAGGEWAPMLLEPGLYLAGDHNVPGLEASFLTGRCAAHHILRGLRQG